ncbi:ABC transporter permease [Halanaerobium praevalens]|uniref:Transport system permease protein n=1 Tax=Halanaerobium praevalens (strain ATCC 33744 / DSM 2228 / GSL) TaxID=572479 RepID=E3DME2_HALPG|nr:iron chelate uptake ABC transporter family permease subunit [Halanaerobium praevalens]ADO76335.1 transport system permease protein [Halanaerobium praevalens DSM 2228]
MKKRYLLLIIFILALISLFLGVSQFSILDIFKLTKAKQNILFLSRIPRLISIITAGMGISIAGLIMQQISQNKFVSPTTAATIDSAQLGILTALIFFPGAKLLAKMSLAFLFAVIGSLLFMSILKKIKVKSVVIIPLVGIMLGRIISATSSFFAYRYQLVQNLSAWMQGDFSMIIEGRYELLYLSIPLIIVAYLYANQFTMTGLGEDFSKNLGLNYRLYVNLGIVIVALISAAVVITVGRIPFLGLIIPNLVTMYYGDNLKQNIMPTALVGAAFLLAADILGRLVIYPYEIPIGLVVGVLGSFIFILLIRSDS